MEETWRTLKAKWIGGHRDREVALQLLFYAWMHWAEPSFLTGMLDDEDDLWIWHEIYDAFWGEDASDAEFLYVTAIMAIVTPWALGDEQVWKSRSERLKRRAFELRPQGFTPTDFDGRGEYGEYFAQQSSRSSGAASSPSKLH